MAMNDGGPAFPQTDLSAYGMGPNEDGNSGMSLRDWFAGQALAGWLTSFGENTSAKPDKVAAFAYEIADAMLAVRGDSDEH